MQVLKPNIYLEEHDLIRKIQDINESNYLDVIEIIKNTELKLNIKI